MAWLYQRNQFGCRYCLTPSPVFYMVGLYKRYGRTVGMIFQPCRVLGNQLKATYKLHMTGERLAYWARQKLRVQYPDFGADLVAGLLEVHCKTQHGVDKGVGGEEQWNPPPLSGDPQMYLMSLLSMEVPRNCPIEGCRGGAETSICGDRIGGLFCSRGSACACVNPCLPVLHILSGPGRPSFV